MRSPKADITELFGYRPDDLSSIARDAGNQAYCPFTQNRCIKTNHDQTTIYGVCSVSHGVKKDIGTEVIVCPNRLYADTYRILRDIIYTVWPDESYELVVGGTFEDLAQKAQKSSKPAIAFGHHSGNEIEASGMSMDWVIQTYQHKEGLQPRHFIGVEVQSIDTTGNYRNNREAYMALRQGQEIEKIPNSAHGLNWANVHKRLIPQLIRKGNIYRRCNRCAGIFFVVPEMVYRKFEDLLGNLPQKQGPAKDHISIITYGLGRCVSAGQQRELQMLRTIHTAFQDFADSFSNTLDPDAPEMLDQKLQTIISPNLF